MVATPPDEPLSEEHLEATDRVRHGRSARLSWQIAVRDSDLDRRDVLVALVLSTWMNGEGSSCHPSLPTIAAATRLDVSNVKRSLKVLEDGEWIRRSPGGGRGRSTRYAARMPSGLVVVEEPAHTRAPLNPKQAQDDDETGAPAHQNRRVPAPRSIQERPKEERDEIFRILSEANQDRRRARSHA